MGPHTPSHIRNMAERDARAMEAATRAMAEATKRMEEARRVGPHPPPPEHVSRTSLPTLRTCELDPIHQIM